MRLRLRRRRRWRRRRRLGRLRLRRRDNRRCRRGGFFRRRRHLGRAGRLHRRARGALEYHRNCRLGRFRVLWCPRRQADEKAQQHGEVQQHRHDQGETQAWCHAGRSLAVRFPSAGQLLQHALFTPACAARRRASQGKPAQQSVRPTARPW
jgi:hypothetical protein